MYICNIKQKGVSLVCDAPLPKNGYELVMVKAKTPRRDHRDRGRFRHRQDHHQACHHRPNRTLFSPPRLSRMEFWYQLLKITRFCQSVDILD